MTVNVYYSYIIYPISHIIQSYHILNHVNMLVTDWTPKQLSSWILDSLAEAHFPLIGWPTSRSLRWSCLHPELGELKKRNIYPDTSIRETYETSWYQLSRPTFKLVFGRAAKLRHVWVRAKQWHGGLFLCRCVKAHCWSLPHRVHCYCRLIQWKTQLSGGSVLIPCLCTASPRCLYMNPTVLEVF